MSEDEIRGIINSIHERADDRSKEANEIEDYVTCVQARAEARGINEAATMLRLALEAAKATR